MLYPVYPKEGDDKSEQMVPARGLTHTSTPIDDSPFQKPIASTSEVVTNADGTKGIVTTVLSTSNSTDSTTEEFVISDLPICKLSSGGELDLPTDYSVRSIALIGHSNFSQIKYKNVLAEFYNVKFKGRLTKDIIINSPLSEPSVVDGSYARWHNLLRSCGYIAFENGYMDKQKVIRINYGPTTKLGTRIVLDALDFLTGGKGVLYKNIRQYALELTEHELAREEAVDVLEHLVMMISDEYLIPIDIAAVYLSIINNALPETSFWIKEEDVAKGLSTYELLGKLGRMRGNPDTSLSFNLLGKDNPSEYKILDRLKVVVRKV